MDSNYLKRAAEKCGFNREVYADKDIPTTHNNVIFFPFLGDLKSMFLLSAVFLKSYKEKRASKYLILGSWPGCQSLFPYVDEYWSIKNDSNLNKLASNVEGYYNNSDVYTLALRSLNDFFDVVSYSDELKREGQDVNLFLPAIASNSILPESFKEGLKKPGTKVVIYPARNIKSWQKGKINKISVNPEFWIALINRLIKEEMVPVLYMDHFTYNLSSEFSNQCLYIVSDTMSHALCAIHQTGLVLNIFSDIDKLAIMARCPYVSVNERRCYLEGKEYEIEDICPNIPRKNVFSFATHTMSGMNWDANVFDIIVKNIKDLQLNNNDQLITTSEINNIISYDAIRKHKTQKMGLRFIKKRPDLGL